MKSESTTLCLSELIGSKEQSNLIWTLWLINQGDCAEKTPLVLLPYPHGRANLVYIRYSIVLHDPL